MKYLSKFLLLLVVITSSSFKVVKESSDELSAEKARFIATRLSDHETFKLMQRTNALFSEAQLNLLKSKAEKRESDVSFKNASKQLSLQFMAETKENVSMLIKAFPELKDLTVVERKEIFLEAKKSYASHQTVKSAFFEDCYYAYQEAVDNAADNYAYAIYEQGIYYNSEQTRCLSEFTGSGDTTVFQNCNNLVDGENQVALGDMLSAYFSNLTAAEDAFALCTDLENNPPCTTCH